MREFKDLKIAVAGTGYVGLSIATLLSQHHKVTAVDIIPEKVELINNKKSPIQDEYIEKYLAEKKLNLTATLEVKEAYSDADFVVIAAPTNYDSKKNFSIQVQSKRLSSWLLSTTRKLSWSLSPRFQWAIPQVFVRSSIATILFLARNFCARAKLCTIIFILLVSSLVLMWIMFVW